MRVQGVARVAAVLGLLTAAGALVAPARASATASSGFTPMMPVLVADSRGGNRLAAGVAYEVTPGGAVPGDATRVAARISITSSVGVGELRVHPCGAYDPAGLVLIDIAGDDDTALAFVTLQGGRFCVTATTPTHVLVAVVGYEQPAGGSAFVATGPAVAVQQASVPAGTVLTVPAAGTGAPAGATALSVSVVASGAQPGFLTLYPCDQPRPAASTLGYPGSDRAWATAAVGALSASGDLCVYAFTTAVVSVTVYGHWAPGATPTATGPLQYAFESSPPPGFVAVEPTRLFDTRSTGARIGGSDLYELDLSADLPATATDVVMNVTVTEPTAAGFVTVYPCESGRPVVSNLNFVAGQTVPNLVTVSLGTDARLCLFSNVPTHVLADLAGWYDAADGDGFLPVTPQRLFDTRTGPVLGAGSTYSLDLSGTVDADTSAVVMNVTVTETGGAGFVTVYPCSAARPTASNLNYVAGQTVPNLVTVAVGADRRVCFYTSGPTHLLADVAGWYAPGSAVGYVGLDPERLFDTRDAAALAAGDTLVVPYGPGDAPGATGDAVVAVVLNLTAVEPVGPGFVTAYPCADGRPTVSNVNYVRGDVVPNLSIVRVDADDDVCFYTLAGTHLLADVAGFFSSLPSLDLVEVR